MRAYYYKPDPGFRGVDKVTFEWLGGNGNGRYYPRLYPYTITVR